MTCGLIGDVRPAATAWPRRIFQKPCRVSAPPRWLRKSSGRWSRLRSGASRTVVPVDPGDGVDAEGHQAFLASLAENPDKAGIEADPVEGQTDQFGHPQTGGVEGLEHGPVAEPEGGRGVRSGEQGVDLVGRQGVRHRPPQARRSEVGGGVGGQDLGLDEEAEERPQGRQGARRRTRRQTGVAARPEIVAEARAFDRLQIELLFVEPRRELAQIAGVGFDRPRAQVALDREMGEELVDLVFGAGRHVAIVHRS